ncbi:MAG: hypothetical protein QOD93_6142 [Acetobacteraceae bacterium]|jgi:hypothetical protein|nr:hypothetical protein [Acetobacteraceae bacterium]
MVVRCVMSAFPMLTCLARGGVMERAGYDSRIIENWTVRFERRAWGGLDNDLARVLEVKLREISQVLPIKPLEGLRLTVPIIADYATPDFPAVAVYHWTGAEPWLARHGEPADKAGSINILQAAEFLSVVQDVGRYPAALLHEVAHAFHDRFVPGGSRNSEIVEAYQRAVRSGIYENVMNVTGKAHRANAIANAMEYFANTTTAYFLRNDDWPEDRAELAMRDPFGLRVIQSLWET